MDERLLQYQRYTCVQKLTPDAVSKQLFPTFGDLKLFHSNRMIRINQSILT